MNFTEAMKEGVFTRLEQIEPKLTASKVWAERKHDLDAVMNAMDAETYNAVWDLIYPMFDLYSRFFYAAGMQDGMKITGAEFPLEICGDRQT